MAFDAKSAKKAEKYAAVLWRFKLNQCHETAPHDFKLCKHFHSKIHDNDRRRDPRRAGPSGPISSPPWAYSLAECSTKNETMFHPDKYKTEPCKAHNSPRGCMELSELCPYRHALINGPDMDAELALVTIWRTSVPENFTWENYKEVMMHYKVDGPCPNDCNTNAFTRMKCVKWHKSDVDQRLPANCNEFDWLPVNMADLPSKSAHSYDPRVYKSKICDRYPNCNFGIYCTFAHSELERTQAIEYRDRLRAELLRERQPPRYVPMLPSQTRIEKRLVVDPPMMVCRVCWNHSAINDVNGKRNTRPSPTAKNCKACGSEWVDFAVYQSVMDPNRWVSIRPTPDVKARLQMCKDRKDSRVCSRPHCTFAHTEEELLEWTFKQNIHHRSDDVDMAPLLMSRIDHERDWAERSPPHIGTSSNFRLCPNKPCVNGDRCKFPHSIAELQEWELRVKRLQFLHKCTSLGVVEKALGVEVAATYATLPSSQKDIALMADESLPVSVPNNVMRVFAARLTAASTDHTLGRVCIFSSSTKFRLLPAEQDGFHYPILTQGEPRGESQPLAPLGPSDSPILLKVQFLGDEAGLYTVSLVVEVDTRYFLKIDLTVKVFAEIVALPTLPAAPAASAPAAVQAAAAAAYSSAPSAPLAAIEPAAEAPRVLKPVVPQMELTAENYRDSMTSFLFAEHKAIDHRLPLCSLVEQRVSVFDEIDNPIIRKHADYLLLCMQLGERADELQIVQPGDFVNLVFVSTGNYTAHVAVVDLIIGDRLVLRCPRVEVPPLPENRGQVTAAFRANPERRAALLAAVERVNLNLVVPPPRAPFPLLPPQTIPVQSLFDQTLNTEQHEFVGKALVGVSSGAPVLLVGHSFSGRTTAVVEVAKQLVSLSASSRVLLVTHSFEAAETLMNKHFIPFFCAQQTCPPLYAGSPNEKCALSDQLLPFAASPVSADLLQAFRIVVCTAANARFLPIDVTFTTVILDDASRVREVDALCALSLGQSVILVGQPHPHTSNFHSPTNTKEGLCESIMKRLTSHYAANAALAPLMHSLQSVYGGGTELLGLVLPSDPPPTGTTTNTTALFYNSKGAELQVCDAPGFCNEGELSELENIIDQFYKGWQPAWGAYDPSQIVVAVPYEAQAARLRLLLAKRQIAVTVAVPTFIPDASFRILIISAVRNWTAVSDNDTNMAHHDDLGLIDDACTLRMLFTRTQSIVAVVGSSATLLQCTNPSARTMWKLYVDLCLRMGTFFSMQVTELQAEVEKIALVHRDHLSGLAYSSPVSHALTSFGRVLWTYHTYPCTNHMPHAPEGCVGYHTSGEIRRDPRRMGFNNELLRYPPWNYSLKECVNDCERMYHPDNYKSKTCSRLLMGGKCDLNDRCPYQHSQHEENEMSLIRRWWDQMASISMEEYSDMTQVFKRSGPCVTCPSDTFTVQCPYFHSDQRDRCAVPSLALGSWAPPLDKLGQIAQLYDPRRFKAKLCDKFPNCQFGHRCPDAHGAVELAQARVLRRELRLGLLLSNPTVKALAELVLDFRLPLPAYSPQGASQLGGPAAAVVQPFIVSDTPDNSWLAYNVDVRASAIARLQAGIAVEQLLFEAVFVSHFAAIRMLVFDCAGDVSRQYKMAAEGSPIFTLLHYACEGGLLEMVHLLCRLGAHTDARDSNKKTPQEMAIEGYATRLQQAKTLTSPAREEMEARAQLCFQCIPLVASVRPAVEEERQKHLQPAPAPAPTPAQLPPAQRQPQWGVGALPAAFGQLGLNSSSFPHSF